jgi:RNA polymerase sigma-70 factor (ECF subfamily)
LALGSYFLMNAQGPGRGIRQIPEEDPIAEKAIIEAFIQGDAAAFKYIYAKYRQRIFSYCLYYTGDKVLAEDAFQEVFTRIYTHRDQLRETKALKSWMLLITRSVCLNSLRTSKFTPEFVSLDAPSQGSDGEYEPKEYKELSIDSSEAMSSNDLLKLALSKLGPIYRDAFLLREFEGYDYEEISKITGASVMNVKVRITRAKKRLRTLLAPYFGAEGKNQSRKGLASISEDLDEDPTTTDSRMTATTAIATRTTRSGSNKDSEAEGVTSDLGPFHDDLEVFAI